MKDLRRNLRSDIEKDILSKIKYSFLVKSLIGCATISVVVFVVIALLYETSTKTVAPVKTPVIAVASTTKVTSATTPEVATATPYPTTAAVPISTLLNYKNTLSWAAFKDTRHKTPTRMVLTGYLESFYNYEFKDMNTYWSVSFKEVANENPVHLNGYIKKDSLDGEQLHSILQDGQPHNLVLEIKYLDDDGGDGVLITKFVQEIVN